MQTAEGHLFCPECQSKVDAGTEPKRKCPVDGTEMVKRMAAGLVLIDICSACGGTWFDKHELEVIQKRFKDDGWNEGFFMGWLF